jgi:hypothetical protein
MNRAGEGECLRICGPVGDVDVIGMDFFTRLA